MTDELENTFQKVRKLAPAQREQLAELIEIYINRMTGRTQPLTPKERELVMEAQAHGVFRIRRCDPSSAHEWRGWRSGSRRRPRAPACRRAGRVYPRSP